MIHMHYKWFCTGYIGFSTMNQIKIEHMFLRLLKKAGYNIVALYLIYCNILHLKKLSIWLIWFINAIFYNDWLSSDLYFSKYPFVVQLIYLSSGIFFFGFLLHATNRFLIERLVRGGSFAHLSQMTFFISARKEDLISLIA